MKREVIQDFLNLPGIAGVALMDGRSRPYFCGVDQTLNFQQKEALAQGILQVVETIPAGFESFEFQFTGHKVHIYKLDRGIILLVLTRNDLVYSDYLITIKNLKAVLQEDISNAIATFRLIAGNLTLSGLTYRKHITDSGHRTGSNTTGDRKATTTQPTSPTQSSNPAPFSKDLTLQELASQQTLNSTSVSAGLLSQPTTIAAHPIADVASVAQPQAGPSLSSPSLKEVMVALNSLSSFTTQYLGTQVIVNYWKTSRPAHEWLSYFQVDRSAQFSFTGPDSQAVYRPLSAQEQQWVQEWVTAFIKRCSQIIRDFPKLVEQKALDGELKALFLS